MTPKYMAFADIKTANSTCLDSKFADSKQKINITNFWEKMGDFQG